MHIYWVKAFKKSSEWPTDVSKYGDQKRNWWGTKISLQTHEHTWNQNTEIVDVIFLNLIDGFEGSLNKTEY